MNVSPRRPYRSERAGTGSRGVGPFSRGKEPEFVREFAALGFHHRDGDGDAPRRRGGRTAKRTGTGPEMRSTGRRDGDGDGEHSGHEDGDGDAV